MDGLGHTAGGGVDHQLHLVAHVYKGQHRRVGHGALEPAVITGYPQVIVGVALHHGGADLRHGAGDGIQRFFFRGGDEGVVLDQAVLQQHHPVVALALRHGGAGGHDLVLADVDHGVHLHQARRILQRHEVGGLTGDVQQQGEGGGVAHLLHLALGAVHGGILLGAGHGVEPGLLGALVGQDEADVGLVADHRGDAGVHIHVVVNGDVVIAVGGLGDVALAEHGVEPAVDIPAVVVVLADDQLGGEHVVHPLRHVRHVVIAVLAGDGVHQHGADDVRAAEEAHGAGHPGADPPGIALLVDLKGGGVEDIGGVAEPQVAVEVAGEVLRRGVADAVLQPHHVHVLGHHVDDQIGRQALGPIIEPLDPVAVFQRRHPDGLALVVDLGIVRRHLKLAHHVGQLAQLAVAQLGGAVTVQHGNLAVGNLLHLGGEVALLHRQ